MIPNVIAAWFTPQLLLDGLVSGLVFGLLAMGVVLVYRATRVINFAVGNMGLVGAGVFALLVVQYGVPYWFGAIVGLAAGTLYGAVIELIVIRRLFTAPRVIVLVATIGIAQLSQALLGALPQIDVPGARFPTALGSAHHIDEVRITGPQLTVLLVVPLVAAALGWFITRTTIGKAVKASAENPDLARLAGISPKAISTMVWAIAGALATLSMALIAAQSGSVTNLDNLGPATLVGALAAAVVAKMSSFPRAVAGGLAIGILRSLVLFNHPDQSGLFDFILFAVILATVFLYSRKGAAETQVFAFATKAAPIPSGLHGVWWIRHMDRLGLVALGVAAAAVPLIVQQPSRQQLYTTIMLFALCGLSLTVLTGWAGQLSLSQMAFAGLGALLAASLVRGFSVDIGLGDARLIRGIQPLPFGIAVTIATLITAALAALIGVGVLRVRGLMLAVVTFAFGLAASQYLYQRPLLSGGFTGSVPLQRSDLFGLDISAQRTFYWLVLAVLAVTMAFTGRLRRSGIGRATLAVRDNPDAAAAYAVRPARTSLRAFALAGGIAGLGGALLAANLNAAPLARYFTVEDSLLLVAIVVVGGLGTVSGPALGSLFVIGLPSFFPGNQVVPLFTSSLGLLVLLLYFPSGLAGAVHAGRQAVVTWAERRYGRDEAPKRRHALASAPARTERTPLPAGTPALRATDVSVHFGGIKAVDGASIRVDPGEIVGLIGTNGAGKSTLMNAIGGFVPSRGTIEVLGRDVTHVASPERARHGLGRTFQAAALFPELTVREAVQLAVEARHRVGWFSTALMLPHAVRTDRRSRREADDLVDFLGLGRYSQTEISALSTGTRRIVELAGLLALDARVLCLDEPTAGVAQRETEAFGPLIREIRRELGASMLVIEHDMPLIMSISDRVYCLELGRVIAADEPTAIRANPLVIASYLGTDERSIERSGPVTSALPIINESVG